jgi:acyl-coenzyme A thioesterase PaaI-like protein
MEKRHEGWIGIPHGGIGIAAVLDLADLCWLQYKQGNLPFPYSISLKFGDRCRLGDVLQLRADLDEDLQQVAFRMRRSGQGQSYIAGTVEPNTGFANGETFDLPSLDDLEGQAVLTPLSIYENCFICGTKRSERGMRRRFFMAEYGDRHYILTKFGFDAGDADIAESFQQAEGVLHPGVIGAVLDEICGWSGFIKHELFGVTVRLKIDFKRPVLLGEKLLFAAAEPEVRGRGKRQLYRARGRLFAVSAEGSYETVATAAGQWLAFPAMREQFYETRIEEDLSRIFF